MEQSDLVKSLDPTVGVGKQATPHSAANKPEVMVPLCLLPGLLYTSAQPFIFSYQTEKKRTAETTGDRFQRCSLYCSINT
jgi:hypothetical protein